MVVVMVARAEVVERGVAEEVEATRTQDDS